MQDAVFDLPGSLESINKWIADNFGRELDGRPKFMLVWTSDEYEKRWGDFVDRSPSGMVIREVTEVRTVLKWPWIANRWALVKLTPVGYEMFYPFEDADRNPLPVIYPALELILYFVTNGAIKESLFDSEERFKKEQEAEEKEIMDKMENEAPLLSNEGGISMRGK
jgi:hypothetical protein